MAEDEASESPEESEEEYTDKPVAVRDAAAKHQYIRKNPETNEIEKIGAAGHNDSMNTGDS
jgi:hypothetical protein